jgi:hypothetical protein
MVYWLFIKVQQKIKEISDAKKTPPERGSVFILKRMFYLTLNSSTSKTNVEYAGSLSPIACAP